MAKTPSNLPVIKDELEFMGIEAAGFATLFGQLEVDDETRSQTITLVHYLCEVHHILVCQGKTASYDIKKLEEALGVDRKVVNKYASKVIEDMCRTGAIRENDKGGIDICFVKKNSEEEPDDE